MSDNTLSRRRGALTVTVGTIVWAAFFIWGLTGVYSRLAHGHVPAAYGSYITWGLWVAGYVYLVGMSAGAYLLSSLVYVFRLEQFRGLGKWALFTAMLTLGLALLLIIFDLGRMERAYTVFTRPNFSSVMAWMIWLYTAYFILLATQLRLAWRLGRQPGEAGERTAKRLRFWATVGIPLAIAFPGASGALFGTVAARPYWHTPLFPILFLTGAFVSGSAVLLAVIAYFARMEPERRLGLARRLAQLVGGLLIFDLLLEWAHYSIPLWYGTGAEVGLMRTILFGPYWYVFWVFHLLLGVLVPLLIIYRGPRTLPSLGFAGGLVAVMYLPVRLNLIIPGLVVPELAGLEEAFVDQRLVFSYAPNAFEWSIVAFVFTLGIAVFHFGKRFVSPDTPEVQS